MFPFSSRAGDDWLKIEEEKPLGAEDNSGQAPSPPKTGPSSSTPEKIKMYRYLSHFDKALQEADQILRGMAELIRQAKEEAAKQQAERDKMNRLAKELVSVELNGLLKNFEKLSTVARDQDADYDRRAGELVAKAKGMCQKAKKWAKERNPEKRKNLLDEIKKEKEELKKNRDRLYADMEKMVADLRGVYRPLEALLVKQMTQKDAYAQKRRQIANAYAAILQSILTVFDMLDKKQSDGEGRFFRKIQAARNAAAQVERMLQGSTPWISDLEKNRVLDSLDESKSIKPLFATLKKRSEGFKSLKPQMDRYRKLASGGGGLPVVKKALANGNMFLVYSWADDEDSRLIRRTLGVSGEPRKVLDAIRERYDQRVGKWKAMRQKVLEHWGCVKKVYGDNSVGLFFKGKLKILYGAKALSKTSGSRCARHMVQCDPWQVDIKAELNARNRKLRLQIKWEAKGVVISEEGGKGLVCVPGKRKNDYWQPYDYKYDPDKNLISGEKYGWTIKGKLEGSTMRFRMQARGKGKFRLCGPVETLSVIQGSLKGSTAEQ